MAMPVVWMYSGQGAQFPHMAAELFAEDDVFRETLTACDRIVTPLIGASLLDLIYDPAKTKSDPLERTLFTHPANVAVAYSLTETLLARGLEPDMLLGYSLGEYVATLVAGGMNLADGLHQIVQQARLLEAKTEPAGMMAILAAPDVVQDYPHLFEECWLAGTNFADHFVVTATKPALEELSAELEAEGITTQILPISHGFHSAMMDPIESDCRQLMAAVGRLRWPLVSCCTMDQLTVPDADHYWSVVRYSIRFYETLQRLDAQGPFLYVDVGPSGTLATFAKYALPKTSASKVVGCLNMFGKDVRSLDRAVATIRENT